MTNNHEADEGRGHLRPLLPEADLPPALRDRVLQSFDRRYRASRVSARWRRVNIVAAATIVFALGLAVGRLWRADGRVAPSGSRFAILLYDGPAADTTDSDVAAHQRWARRLASEGRLTFGEKLSSTVIDLGPPSSPAVTPLRGFFIINAPSREAAAAIARTLPHWRRGGRVIVRPIDPT